MRLRSLHRLRQAALRISPAVKAQRGSRPLSMPMRRNCLRLEPIEASRTRSREAFSAASVVTDHPNGSLDPSSDQDGGRPR